MRCAADGQNQRFRERAAAVFNHDLDTSNRKSNPRNVVESFSSLAKDD
jgi:hypothetical protein